MASKLDGFSFGFDGGTELRGVEKCDNVIWVGDKCCVAIVYQTEPGVPNYRLDYGDEKHEGIAAGYALKHSEYFEVFDPLTIKCVALQWVTHGGNIKHD